MKGFGWLILAGLGALALSKKDESITSADVINSPTGSAAGANIASVYGDEFASDLYNSLLSSQNAGEVFDEFTHSPLNTKENLIDTSAFVTPGGKTIPSPDGSGYAAYILPVPQNVPISYVSQAEYDDQVKYVANLYDRAISSADPTRRLEKMNNYERQKALLDAMRVR